MNRLLAKSLLLLGALTLSTPVQAICVCSCTINSTTAVAFGTYNPLPGTSMDGTGLIRTTCEVLVGVLSGFSIALGPGNRGNYSGPRQMRSGSNNLLYNLYTTTSYTSVWGNGTAGTVMRFDGSLLSLLGVFQRDFFVYGRILPGQQTTPVGVYTDTITVTVTFN
ncbi:MAG: spore coat protein U domain-containing protein [Burkholderiales bacterium]|nr:spore coat protein U domain-containing protein [Burkholderiales bacterium]